MLFCKFTEHPRSVRIEPTVISSIASLPPDAGQKASRVCRIASSRGFLRYADLGRVSMYSESKAWCSGVLVLSSNR